jgi:hypothetical protein
MNQLRETAESQKTAIVTQIAALSRLLGMIPANDAIQMHEPLTENKMAFSDWLSAVRGSFLKLSLLISKEMNIAVQ